MRIFIFIALQATLAFADLSQSLISPDDPAAASPGYSASFTDPARYNSYDFYGSPLGLFEKESAHVKVDLGYRYTGWHQVSSADSLKQTGSLWNAPRILVGSPKNVYMQLFYAPGSMVWDMAPWPAHAVTLDVKRFGLTIAGQVPSGLFQLAFRGNGYVGKETLDGSPNTRMLMGLDALTVSIGSRIRETVAIGIEGGARAKLDTLVSKSNPALHDRFFDGQLPIIGGFIDIKRADLPVASAFSFSTGTSRFIYVTRNITDPGSVNQDPIMGDSLAWRWQTVGNIAKENIVYHPALFLGYWSNKYQAYAPTATNDNLDVGALRGGRDWTVADFCFGIGSSMAIAKYGTAWFEYSHSSLELDHGTAWPTAAGREGGYHRFGLGLEVALHAVPALNFPSSIETFARFGFFNERENSGVNAFQSENFGMIDAVAPSSRLDRYSPDFGVWGEDRRIIGTTLGLGGSIFSKMISVDSYITFLSMQSREKSSGLEFGFDCGYCFN